MRIAISAKSHSSAHSTVQHLCHLCKQNTWYSFITRKKQCFMLYHRHSKQQTSLLSKEKTLLFFYLLCHFRKFWGWAFFPVKMARKNQNLSQIIVHQKDLKSADYNTDSTRITCSHQFGLLKPSLAPGEKKRLLLVLKANQSPVFNLRTN